MIHDMEAEKQTCIMKMERLLAIYLLSCFVSFLLCPQRDNDHPMRAKA